MEPVVGEGHVHAAHREWTRWPVYWSAIWVGVLAAVAVALLFGLAAIAVGAHEMGPGRGIVKWSEFGMGALFFGVVGSFAAFVAGGWIAGRIAGVEHAETAMLQGAIVWLLTVPMFITLAALGAGNLFGAWFNGLAGTPVWVGNGAAGADPNAAAAARNGALGAFTMLLISLIGSVLGGWMASGEPMTVNLRRTARHDMPIRRAV